MFRDNYGSRDRGGGFGGGFNSAADDDRSWRRDKPEIPERSDIRDEPYKQEERKRIVLQPRSKPNDDEKGNIF